MGYVIQHSKNSEKNYQQNNLRASVLPDQGN